jgi:WhiB family transcriptional regulator, redox-sensing transcriptional regulator
MDRALCRDSDHPERWWPGQHVPDEYAEAACVGCAVTTECLKYALTNHQDHGTWGGVSETRRASMTKPSTKSADTRKGRHER